MNRYVWSTIFATAIGALLFGTVPFVHGSSASADTPTGTSFLTKAAEINLGEVRLGNVAKDKANSPAARKFAALMVSDHQEAEKRLETLAESQGVKLPTQPDIETRNFASKLSTLLPSEFDPQYMTHMLAGHEGAVAMFENEIQHDQNDSIQTYAENTLPVIQDHLRIAEHIAGQLGIAGEEGLSQPTKDIVQPSAWAQ
jgi:putative membrane protein